MPAFLENALRKSGKKKGLKGQKLEAYVYGGMNDIGAMKGSKETTKGKNMQKKHNSDMKKGIAKQQIEVKRKKKKKNKKKRT